VEARSISISEPDGTPPAGAHRRLDFLHVRLRLIDWHRAACRIPLLAACSIRNSTTVLQVYAGSLLASLLATEWRAKSLKTTQLKQSLKTCA
jgi:hypothetical protein